jgi:hypothetical protein
VPANIPATACRAVSESAADNDYREVALSRNARGTYLVNNRVEVGCGQNLCHWEPGWNKEWDEVTRIELKRTQVEKVDLKIVLGSYRPPTFAHVLFEVLQERAWGTKVVRGA